jgi:cell division protein ZapA (FtsZ GTPase activity inhibitor)
MASKSKADKDKKDDASLLQGQALYSVRVSLCGETVPVKSDQPLEVVQRVAAYINAKVKQAGGPGLANDKFRILALAALGITGELFEAKAKLEEQDKDADRLQAQAQALSRSLDRVLAGGD